VLQCLGFKPYTSETEHLTVRGIRGLIDDDKTSTVELKELSRNFGSFIGRPKIPFEMKKTLKY